MTSIEDSSELSDWNLPLSFMKNRHKENIEGIEKCENTWRMKERMKTVSVALVLCLNIGVDPPDVMKTSPCARMECWFDPMSTSPRKALEQIGANLQKQYERWQPRARYKPLLDPTVDDVKKLCTSLRRNAKSERVLFHYNGHGVPKPTSNGEIWFFNKSYTQYIPMSLYDLQTWMGSPSIYVYDCSHAGQIIESFEQFSYQRDSEFMMLNSFSTSRSVEMVNLMRNTIQLAACGKNEILPMKPELPADLFTSCLTSPIKASLRWFCLRKISKKLVPDMDIDLVEKIPGRLNDRRSALGELNWIFTAITDTIAWVTLPRDLFQELFRQDLLVASLFRNFLLAERIMRSYNCTPLSQPQLPATYHHPLWDSWDMALDHCLSQLQGIVDGTETYKPNNFFAYQLKAFQVWLVRGLESRRPPEQLPIVLQVLLSQLHRLQALELLSKFLDLGPSAVHLALSVGIFPYMLKLLQSKSRELQPVLVFIWAKILAIDGTCQVDLVKDSSHKYFLSVLADPDMQCEYRTMAAFVLAMIVKRYPDGQRACVQSGIIATCLEQLEESNPVLRQWLAICLACAWEGCDDARWHGVRDNAHEKLYKLLWDEIPEVRTSGVFALGTYVANSSDVKSDQVTSINLSVGTRLLPLMFDASPLVRQEVVAALHGIILHHDYQFQVAALCTSDTDLPHLSTSITPTGWINIHHVDQDTPSDQASSSSSKINGYSSSGTSKPLPNKNALSTSLSSSSGEGFLDSLPRKGSGTQSFTPAIRTLHSTSASMSALPSGIPHATYSNIWKSIVNLADDPWPDVCKMASIIITDLKDKAGGSSRLRAVGDNTGSYSAPSSPTHRTRNNHREQSPNPPQESLPSSGRTNPHYSSQTVTLPHFHKLAAARRPRNIIGEDDTSESDSDTDEERKYHISMRTQFCSWCCKYFAHSITKQPEDTDPCSEGYLQREWRFIRNANCRKQALSLKHISAKSKFSDQLFVNKNTLSPNILKFHPYEPHLSVVSKSSVSVWDMEQGNKLSSFPIGGNLSVKITSVDYINPHDITFLLTGSDDGVVKVWRDYANPNSKPQLVTSWRAIHDMLPTTNKSAGLVLCWEQATGLLYSSGDVQRISLWDTHKEMKTQDIPTNAGSCVTSLASDSARRSLLVAGCGDGTVRLFDRRQPTNNCLVSSLDEHKGWVINVHIQEGSNGHIISSSVTGDIKYWDPRFTQSVKTLSTTLQINSCDVHQYAPLLACASRNHSIKIYSTDSDDLINSIRYHDGFMGQKIGPTRCLAFHPYKAWLAAGGSDGLIAVYSLDKKR
ncbi:regulatory-associated protein of mTOR-like [Dysidea avara]|uniref:regulatory-associated protein of mTOR-like n=1 Tax=Dysidea avara TaxID=196820 RepID=UPI00331765A3